MVAAIQAMNASSSISIIPPGPGGVKDYALLVGAALEAPLVELTPQTPIDGFGGRVLLVHFSGYGYQKRGVPLWLVRAVREMRPRFDSVGFVFHELFAVGPPWRSAFWLSGIQKVIARDMLAMADFWITSREDSARWLLAARAEAMPHRVLPIFSTVGEPDAITNSRKDEIVVFGTSGVRANVYQWADGEIFRSAERKGLQIHDIGPAFPPQSALATRLAASGAVVHGKLPADEVDARMAAARYGALAYPAEDVAKSSVFAAYCAHGLCTILLSPSNRTRDGLVANRHYAFGFEALDDVGINPARIGREARSWYEPHRLSAHQAALRQLAAQTAQARRGALPSVAKPPMHGVGSPP